MYFRSLAVAFILSLPASQGAAQSVNMEVAKVIREFADGICGVYELSGQREETELTGAAEARVKGFVAKLADLGVEGTAKLKAEKYTNVASGEIATELKDIRQCRKSVWEDMKEAVFATPAPAAAPEAAPEKSGALGDRRQLAAG